MRRDAIVDPHVQPFGEFSVRDSKCILILGFATLSESRLTTFSSRPSVISDPSCSLRRFGSIVIAAILMSLACATNAQGASSILSQQALLSPQVHTGQTLTYFITVQNYPARWMHCQGGCHPYSDSLVIACSVESLKHGSIALQRRVRGFLPTQIGPIFNKPPISMRGGRAFKPDGSPLNTDPQNMDPICPIYSADLWGTPPRRLLVGTIWRFVQPAPSNPVGGLRGTVTVRTIDAESGAVSLHIASSERYSRDLVVSEGGIVLSEVERSSESTFDSIVIATLQDHTLARLWSLPPTPSPPLPDVLNPNGRFFDITRSRLIPRMVIVRLWHFGPYFLTWPNFPKLSDWLLFVGVVLLVMLVSRAEVMVVQGSGVGALAPLQVGRLRLLIELALGFATAAAAMWLVYR